jgi:hypothetical protein
LGGGIGNDEIELGISFPRAALLLLMMLNRYNLMMMMRL